MVLARAELDTDKCRRQHLRPDGTAVHPSVPAGVVRYGQQEGPGLSMVTSVLRAPPSRLAWVPLTTPAAGNPDPSRVLLGPREVGAEGDPAIRPTTRYWAQLVQEGLRAAADVSSIGGEGPGDLNRVGRNRSTRSARANRSRRPLRAEPVRASPRPSGRTI